MNNKLSMCLLRGGGARRCVSMIVNVLRVLFVWFVYINCVIFIYIIICIGYARAHDVGAAHSE